MQSRGRAGAARGCVIPSPEIHVVEIRVTRGTCEEVQLPRVGRDDRVPLEGPVRRRRDRVEGERNVRGGNALVQVEVEFAPVCVVERDSAPDREVP